RLGDNKMNCEELPLCSSYREKSKSETKTVNEVLVRQVSVIATLFSFPGRDVRAGRLLLEHQLLQAQQLRAKDTGGRESHNISRIQLSGWCATLLAPYVSLEGNAVKLGNVCHCEERERRSNIQRKQGLLRCARNDPPLLKFMPLP